jgi:hypothetical protein
MDNVVLFATPKVDPLPVWSPAAEEISHLSPGSLEDLRQIKQTQREIHIGILERAALVAQVFGMPELARLNVADASVALMALTRHRSDVCAVLRAYYGRKSATARKVG